MGAKWQRIKIKVPDYFDDEERRELADEIIAHIRKRTESGRDKDGAKFPPYSKSYINSLEFKLAGKSKSRVNLRLSGEMVEALDLLSHKKKEIVIGFERGSVENAKADGNIRGTYGGDEKPSKARDFLGISDTELDRLIARIDRASE